MTINIDDPVVKICNGNGSVRRVFSLREDCSATSLIFEDSRECSLRINGWAEFEPGECRGIDTSSTGNTYLGVYARTGDSWEPVHFSADGERVEFGQTENLDTGTFEATDIISVCGYVDRHFELFDQDVLIDQPCPPERKSLFIGLYVKTPSRSNYQGTGTYTF